jgi:hypothetical protein
MGVSTFGEFRAGSFWDGELTPQMRTSFGNVRYDLFATEPCGSRLGSAEDSPD